MDKGLVELEFSIRFQKDVEKAIAYIITQGYPANAYLFYVRVLKFAESLTLFPEKYPFCRKLKLVKNKYRCVPFEEEYVFVYCLKANKLIIKRFVKAKRLG